MPLPLLAVPAIAAAGASLMSGLGNAISGSSAAKNTRKAYENYLNYLNGISSSMKSDLEGRAEKYDQKLQAMAGALEEKMLAQPGEYEDKLQALLYDAEPQYLKEANTQLGELEQLNKDIVAQSADAQRQNRRQIQAELAQQGVRGGQAAILANRATGELNRDLQRDINQNIYNEAINRQNSRLGYTQTKALYPYQALAGAYGNSFNNANQNISNAYANSYTNANNALSNAYGSSLLGANNSLSNAQANVYANAYNNAMNSYLGTQNMNASGAAKYIGGGLSMLGGALNSGINTFGNTLKSVK